MIGTAQAPPVVTVCIANYNGMAVIDDCIRSVLEQNGAPTVEIIVHDDASTDDSVEHLRQHYPDVKLIASTHNVGFCVANNRMVAQAQGEYALLLNNDAALFPDALATLYRTAVEIALPAILSLPQFDFESGELLDRGSLLDLFFNPVPNLDPARNDVGMVMGACLWIPRALWYELGGFPEWFESVAEDLYLCCRARLRAHPVRVAGASGYRHRVGQSFGGGKVRGRQLSTTFRRRALSERNKTFVLVTTCPAPQVFLLLPLHLSLLLIEGALLSVFRLDFSYLGKVYLPVFRMLLKLHRQLRAERLSATATRCIPRGEFFGAFDWLPYKLRMLFRHGLPRVD